MSNTEKSNYPSLLTGKDYKYTCGGRETLKNSLKLITLEDFNNLTAYPKEGWAKSLSQNMKKLTEEEENALFTITGVISILKTKYYSLFNPWTKTSTDNSFEGDYIKNAYEDLSATSKKKDVSEDDIASELVIKKDFYQKIYGYLLIEDMIKSNIEFYYTLETLSNILIVNPLNIDIDKCQIRFVFRDISLRGRRRVNMWPIYCHSVSYNTRRSPQMRFRNILPEQQHQLDKFKDDCEWQKANYLNSAFIGTRIGAHHPHIREGVPCLGGWNSKLAKLSDYGYFNQFLKTIKSYLNTWTIESPYWNINNQFETFYTFKKIGRRKRVRWDSIDSIFILQRYGVNPSSPKGQFMSKMLSMEKHENGFYTSKTINEILSYWRLKSVNYEDVCMVFNAIHDKRRDSFLGKARTGYGGYSGYNVMRGIYEYAYKLHCGSLSIPLRRFDKFENHEINVHFILKDTLKAMRDIVMFLIDKNEKDIRYDEIKDNKWNFDKKVKLFNGDLKEIIKPALKESTYIEPVDISNISKLRSRDIVSTSIIFEMLTNYNFYQSNIKRWIIETYKVQINKLTKQKKEYSDEVINISKNGEQSELFSQQVPN